MKEHSARVLFSYISFSMTVAFSPPVYIVSVEPFLTAAVTVDVAADIFYVAEPSLAASATDSLSPA